MKSSGTCSAGSCIWPFMIKKIMGTLVEMPSFQPRNGKSIVVSQHAGRAIEPRFHEARADELALHLGDLALERVAVGGLAALAEIVRRLLVELALAERVVAAMARLRDEI